MEFNRRVRAGLAWSLITGTALMKRVRSNVAWSLVTGVVIVEWHQPRRIILILAAAVLSAALNGLFDVANERWPKPVRWRLPQRRGPGKGAA